MTFWPITCNYIICSGTVQSWAHSAEDQINTQYGTTKHSLTSDTIKIDIQYLLYTCKLVWCFCNIAKHQMGVFFNDSISSVGTFLMLVNRNNLNYVICLHLDYLLSYPPPATGHSSGVFFKVVCVTEYEAAGLCLKKATVQGAYCSTVAWGSIQMGCVYMELCLPGNPLAWSLSLIDEMCSHIQQLTPHDSNLALTGWHWRCTVYFFPTPIFLSLSLSCSFPNICYFPLLFRNNNETPLL